MKNRKLISILSTMAIVTSLFAGCAGNNGVGGNDGQNTGQEQKTNVKVGLVTDEGGINDKSFNQSADAGLDRAVEELGVQYKYIESTSKDAYTQNLQALAMDFDAGLTFSIGYQMAQATAEMAKQAPDKSFAIVDEKVDAPNVQSLLFKEHEGSFLTGVIAAKMSKTNKIGFIGGKEGDVIGRFEAGFVAGARAINPDIKVDIRYADSFSDSNRGYELGKAQYDAGCDIIMHAAGGVGIGLFQVAKEIRDAGKEVWAIGVDSDQVLTLLDENNKPQYADIILTSMIKRVDTATFQATKEMVDGTFKGGQVITFGLKEEGVGIAPSSRGEVPEDMKDSIKPNVPQDILTLVDKYIEAIKDGTIVVPDKPADAKNFTAEPLS